MILFKALIRVNKWTIVSIALLVFLSGGRTEAGGILGIPEIPKVPAFLPTLDQVPAGQPMPLDGVWLIPSRIIKGVIPMKITIFVSTNLCLD